MAELNGTPIDPRALEALALTNYGHFTSMRVENQEVRGLSQHLDRLVRDCRVVFDAELDRDRVRELIRRTAIGHPESFVVRVTIFDPAVELGRPSAPAEPHVLVTTRSAAAWPMTPLRVQSARYVREVPLVKHVGLFGALWHRRAAQVNGFDDALFVDFDGHILEGATWNIGFFDGERVVWPSGDVLPGVTMKLLSQVHEQTIYRPVSLAAVADMQAAFAANTAIGVRAISGIDQVPLEDSPIIEILQKEYAEIPAESL